MSENSQIANYPKFLDFVWKNMDNIIYKIDLDELKSCRNEIKKALEAFHRDISSIMVCFNDGKYLTAFEKSIELVLKIVRYTKRLIQMLPKLKN